MNIDMHSTKCDQDIARQLHNIGIELTPEQVHKLKIGAFKKMRKNIESLGRIPPKSDMELLRIYRPIIEHWIRKGEI